MNAAGTSEVEALQGQLAEARAEAQQLRQRLQEETRVLNHLIQVGTLLNATLNLQELLRMLMSLGKEMFDAEACSILLVDEDTNELVFEVALGEKEQEVSKHRIPPGQGIAGKVAQSGEALVINSVKDYPEFYAQIDRSVGFQTRNMLALPLKVKDRIIGVVEMINKREQRDFEEKDVMLGMTLANQAAVAIDNGRMYQHLSEALVNSRMSYRL